VGAPITSISVIVPLRNERANVESFVDDLAAQDFEGDVEVLVADGASDDGGIERLQAAARDAGVRLRVIDNPAAWVSHGLNVGGRLVPTGTTRMERAVACAMDSPFGGIGWTRSSAGAAVETDTVTFGAFRPEVFERVGLFDEALVRNQDDEFNLRLRAAGGRIVLDPAITVMYRPRGSFAGVWRQYFAYGLWKVPVMLKHRRIATVRGVVPLMFVAGSAGLLATAVRSRTARRLLAAEWLVYGALGVAFAARGLRRRGEPWTLMPAVLAAFPTIHVAFGTGEAAGLARALWRGRR
jgi:succinoglycan biosynthesis protein ExoA